MTLSVFGARYATSPGALGFRGARYLVPTERPHGWFAVSFNHLHGIGLRKDTYRDADGFAWLAPHEPHARIGNSILLYNLP